MTAPDFATLSTSVSPIPELESLEHLALEAPRVRTHAPEAGRRRVFIPDMPVTPVSERRCGIVLRLAHDICWVHRLKSALSAIEQCGSR